jgi:hypothetical protein
MEKLNEIWFIKNPVDVEHKNYILLDYLKRRSQILSNQNVTELLYEITRIVKNLNLFKQNRTVNEQELLSDEDRKEIRKWAKLKEDDPKWETLLSIIDSSLNILFEFSGVCFELLEDDEEKIKIFKIESKFEGSNTDKKTGIVLIRNMITDRIISYYFGESKMSFETEDKDIVFLKKVNIKNKTFSLSYEHIYHEVLNEFGSSKNSAPRFYIIEIYEDFKEDSFIFKNAKKKFLNVLATKKMEA